MSQNSGGDETPICSECGRDDFDSEKGLNIHKSKSHGNSSATEGDTDCPVCGESFGSRIWTSRHMNSEHGETLGEYEERTRGEHQCPSCHKTFDSAHSMKIHHARSHGESIAGIEITCRWCGETATVRKHEYEFCDEDCYGEWVSENKSGENNPNWKGGLVEIACVICGETDKRKPDQVERAEHTFCSPECRNIGRSLTAPSGEDHPNWADRVDFTCEQCGSVEQETPYRAEHARFCSKSCLLEWRSETLVGERAPGWEGGKSEFDCDYCGETRERHESHLNAEGNNFCNRRCLGKWRSENVIGQDHPCWSGGAKLYTAIRALLRPPWSMAARRVRNRDGHSCQLCGDVRSEEEWRYPVHHIVPINSGGVNADELLMTTCRSCHRKVEEFTKQFTERHLRDWTDEELPEGRTPSREYLEEVSEPGDPYYSGDPPTGQADLSSFAD